MGRPKHPQRAIERLLGGAEDQGWAVDYNEKNNIWRLKCDCGAHMKWAHKTPSNPRYALNLRKWMERTGCFKAEEG